VDGGLGFGGSFPVRPNETTFAMMMKKKIKTARIKIRIVRLADISIYTFAG
jgi:hypothetical protein